jgi:hypothetical protein
VADVPTPTYPDYADLLAAAQASVRADGGFVDPVKLRRCDNLHRSRDWRISVLGHDNGCSLLDMHMLLLADARGLEPPMPQWLVDLRAEQDARRFAEEEARKALQLARDREWRALVEALPVPVHLAYNYSGPNHYESWTQGAIHILVGEDLHVGRLRRSCREALCTVESNAHQQDFARPACPEDRHPSCKRCIRTACRLTELEAPILLAGSTARAEGRADVA